MDFNYYKELNKEEVYENTKTLFKYGKSDSNPNFLIGDSGKKNILYAAVMEEVLAQIPYEGRVSHKRFR